MSTIRETAPGSDGSYEERFLPLSYRSPKLKAATWAISFLILATGIFLGETPWMVLSSFILAFLSIAVMQFGVEQLHLLDYEEEEVVLVTSFYKWSRYEFVESFENMGAIIVNPRVDMWSRTHQWCYPISALTGDGREIVLKNESGFDNYDYAAETAESLAESLGCPAFCMGDKTPLEIVEHGHDFLVRPKSQDTGILGRAVALAVVGGFLWGMFTLVSQSGVLSSELSDDSSQEMTISQLAPDFGDSIPTLSDVESGQLAGKGL